MPDLATLRARLRNVNIEYSALLALLKSEAHGRTMRMAQLRADRQRLMALLETSLQSSNARPPLPAAHRQSA
jgi:hypothetical protein